MTTVTPLLDGPSGSGSEQVTFGMLLKEWRQHRRLSQLQLALASGISQRHISYLETGKAQPSRRSVLDLAETLDVPLRERNALLRRAGFSELYPDEPLEAAALGLFRTALDQMLAQHEPYPALLLDGHWRLAGANSGALRFFSQFIDPSVLLGNDDPDASFPVVRLCLSDSGLKPYFENWEEIAYSFLQRARRALLANPRDEALAELIELLMAQPDAPRSWRTPDWSRPAPPAVTLRFRKGPLRLALFTMLAHFGTPQQTVAEDLSVELFFPADEHSRQHLEALAAEAETNPP